MVIHLVAKRFCVVLGLLAVWLIVVTSVSARAETAIDCETDCVPIGEWSFRVGLGVGLRTNPLYDGDDTPLLVLPELSYYGRRFFLKNFEMGYTLFETDRHQLNALVTPGYDQMLFNRWDPLNFTDNGGVGAFVPPAAASSPRTYQVSISYSEESRDAPARGGGAPPPLASEPGLISPVPPAMDRLEVASNITVAVEGVSTIYVNGREIYVAPGRRQAVTGVEANVIDINYLLDGTVSVSGVTASDEVRLQGELNVVDSSARNAGEIADPIGTDITVELDGAKAVLEPVAPLEPDVVADTAAATDKRVSADQVRKRKVAGLAGLEYSYRSDSFTLHLQALQDFTRVHQGAEARAALTVPWQYKTHQFALTTGVNWQSRKVIDYYYGVTLADVGDVALLYEPLNAAFTPLLRLDWQKSISERWSLRGFVQYMPLSREVKASPIVDSSNISAVFIGGVYHF